MDDLSEQLSTLVNEGRKGEARRLLAGILQQDPNNAQAWAMMAEVADDPQQEADCLQCVLELTDDPSLREWAAARLAGLETAELPKESIPKGPKRSHPEITQSPTAKSKSLKETALLWIGSTVLIAAVFGIFVYWWLPTTNPQLAAQLPFLLARTPTSAAHIRAATPKLRDTLTPTSPPTLTPTMTRVIIFTLTPTPVIPSATPDTPTPTLEPFSCSEEGLPETACSGVYDNYNWAPYIKEIGGTQMTLIPAGCFVMGSTARQIKYLLQLPTSENSRMTLEEEQPAHTVCFERPFWLDVVEVTNEQFGSIGCLASSSGPDQPRTCVSWEEAAGFCKARGARLPTEAEWEYAVRGPDSLIFPWGNEFVGGYIVWKAEQTANVGSIPEGASWVAALDLSGNVWEWMADWYSETYYGSVSADRAVNPQGPPTGKFRVTRGGAWDNSKAVTFHAAYRSWDFPNRKSENLGFRCARTYY